MRDRLDRHDGQTLGALALVKTPDRRIVSNRAVRSFNERPAQVFVAAPPVANALALAVRLAPAIHHARVGSKLAGRGEPMHIARLQRDRQSQHIADAAHGLERVKLLPQLAFGKNPPLEEPDLLLETTHHRYMSSQSTLLVLKQRQSVNLPILQALDIVTLDRLRQVAGEQVMDA